MMKPCKMSPMAARYFSSHESRLGKNDWIQFISQQHTAQSRRHDSNTCSQDIEGENDPD